jgi:hypothetical protein
MNSQDIFVRAHTVVEEGESKKKKETPFSSKAAQVGTLYATHRL